MHSTFFEAVYDLSSRIMYGKRIKHEDVWIASHVIQKFFEAANACICVRVSFQISFLDEDRPTSCNLLLLVFNVLKKLSEEKKGCKKVQTTHLYGYNVLKHYKKCVNIIYTFVLHKLRL